jgi:hypothetical protein
VILRQGHALGVPDSVPYSVVFNIHPPADLSIPTDQAWSQISEIAA